MKCAALFLKNENITKTQNKMYYFLFLWMCDFFDPVWTVPLKTHTMFVNLKDHFPIEEIRCGGRE